MIKKAYRKNEDLKHYGVLGMRWGVRKAGGETRTVAVGKGVRGAAKEVAGLVKDAAKDDIGRAKSLASKVLNKFKPKEKAPETKAIIDEANKIFNDPKSSEADMARAHKMIGIDPKTGRLTHTDAVYDKNGNDVSVRPMRRLFKEKGQSDKDFDAEVDAEMNPKPEKLVGKPVKTLFGTRTEAVYDKDGNDISSKPFGRPFKKKGQSDKDYDNEDNDVANEKIVVAELERQHKVQFGVTLAMAGVTAVATYAAKKSLEKAAKEAILQKYGPKMAELIIKSKFG